MDYDCAGTSRGFFGPTCVGEYPSHGYLARPGARKIEPLGQNAEFKMGRDIVFAMARAGLLQRGTSILLVFGLGRRGLDDRDVYPLGRYHFDLTGRGLSLETATAIGAAPALIAAHLVE